AFLRAIRDVVHDNSIFDEFKEETGFQKSLLRDVSARDITGAFRRALTGDAELTPYDFVFRFQNDDGSKAQLAFNVVPNSRPPTNIHVLIGRNGVGKTRLLAGIADAVTENKAASIGLVGSILFGKNEALEASNEFLNLIIVSYSAFDRFDPIPKGT